MLVPYEPGTSCGLRTLAAASGDLKKLQKLAKKHDLNQQDEDNRTPLRAAASNGDNALISLLLQYGADASDKDANGWTAGDHAAMYGYSELSKKLLGCGKDIEKSSSDSRTSLPVFIIPAKEEDAGFTLGAPATNKEGKYLRISALVMLRSDRRVAADVWNCYMMTTMTRRMLISSLGSNPEGSKTFPSPP